jgi:hypothetical protein
MVTTKQLRFVDEYRVDLNATQAAIRAGYSPSTAYSQGQRLLKNVDISKAILSAQSSLSKKIDVAVDDIVRGLMREATFAGPGSSHSARVAALAHLGRYLGMFNQNNTDASGESSGLIINIHGLAEVVSRKWWKFESGVISG